MNLYHKDMILGDFSIVDRLLRSTYPDLKPASLDLHGQRSLGQSVVQIVVLVLVRYGQPTFILAYRCVASQRNIRVHPALPPWRTESGSNFVYHIVSEL